MDAISKWITNEIGSWLLPCWLRNDSISRWNIDYVIAPSGMFFAKRLQHVHSLPNTRTAISQSRFKETTSSLLPSKTVTEKRLAVELLSELSTINKHFFSFKSFCCKVFFVAHFNLFSFHTKNDSNRSLISLIVIARCNSFANKNENYSADFTSKSSLVGWFSAFVESRDGSHSHMSHQMCPMRNVIFDPKRSLRSSSIFHTVWAQLHHQLATDG